MWKKTCCNVWKFMYKWALSPIRDIIHTICQIINLKKYYWINKNWSKLKHAFENKLGQHEIKNNKKKPLQRKKFRLKKTLDLKKKLKIVFFHTCIKKCREKLLVWKSKEHQQSTTRRQWQTTRMHNKEVVKSTRGQRSTWGVDKH
jgi:hypothetical protein